jgi:hypothetical protein
MNKKQIIVILDARLKDAAKALADECDVSMKELIKTAIIDILKKHDKSIPVYEL